MSTCNINSTYEDMINVLSKNKLSDRDVFRATYTMGFNEMQLDNTQGRDSQEVLAYLNRLYTDKTMSGVVTVSYNGSNKKVLRKIVTVKYSKEKMELTVKLDDGTSWTLYGDNARSKKSAKGTYVEIKELENIRGKLEVHKEEIKEMLKESDRRKEGAFGSRGDPKGMQYRPYEELEKDMWKNPEKMQDLLEVLVSNDQVDDEHTDYLRKLLKMIVGNNKKVLNEFRIFVAKEAKQNRGVAIIDKKNSKLMLELSKIDSDNLAQEVYLHELIHLSVEFALQYNKGKLKGVTNKLAELYSQAQDYITIDKLIGAIGDVEEAKRLHSQMFKGRKSLSEFIALGMTNKHVKQLLKEMRIKTSKMAKGMSTFDKMFMLVRKLLGTVKKFIDVDSETIRGDKALQHYVSELWEINRMTVKKEGLYNKTVTAINSSVDALDKTIVKNTVKVVKPVTKAVDEFLDRHENLKIIRAIGVVWYLGKVVNPFQSDIQNQSIKRVLSEWSVLWDKIPGIQLGWLVAPENSVMQLIDYIKHDDPLKVKIEKLALSVQKIDMFRQETMKRVGRKVKNAYDKNIGRKVQTAITRVLVENDVQSLLKVYSVGEIKTMLSDDTELTQAIQKEYATIDRIVNSQKVRNYVKSQAKGLGYKLATGISGRSVQQNAFGIVTLKDTGLRLNGVNKKGFKELLHAVDRLATLEGLVNTDSKLKEKVSELSEDGIETTLAVHAVYVANAIRYSKNYSVHAYPNKGEIKDTKDEQIDIRIGVDTKEMAEQMKNNGYYKTDYKAPKGLVVYINKNYGNAEFTKQAMAKINEGKKMHFINYADEDTRDAESFVLSKMAAEDIEKQINGVVMPTMDGFQMMHKKDGTKMYGYTLDKFKYAEMTYQDNKVPLLLGKMIAEIEEKAYAHKLNDKVYTLLLKDMSKNYKRGDALYVEVGPDAKVKGKTAKLYSDRLWGNMPQGLRKKVLERKKGNKYVALRRDVADMYVGRRMPSLFNMNIPFVGKTVETVMNANDKIRLTKEFIKGATKWWEQLVSIQKVDIVIRTPKVFIDNVRSNFNWGVALGQNPFKLLKDYTGIPAEVNDYVNKRKEADALKLDARLEADLARKRELMLKASNIMKAISKNTIHDLYEAGLFTTIQQDVEDSDLIAKNRVEKAIEKNKIVKKVSEQIPQIVKDGFNTLYVTEGTGAFDVLEKSMQYSDFVARVSLYRKLLEKGLDKKLALKMVTEAFVNYNRMLPSLMAWAEKLGLEWFMKYTLGANKNIVTALKYSPTKVLLMSTLLDAPNPSDVSVFEKDFGYAFKNPWDVGTAGIEDNVLPPSSLELMGLI